jgi:hypothetical protein
MAHMAECIEWKVGSDDGPNTRLQFHWKCKRDRRSHMQIGLATVVTDYKNAI